MLFKKRLLTDSDIRIIESHSKKNLTDAIHDIDNMSISYHEDIGMKPDKTIDKS